MTGSEEKLNRYLAIDYGLKRIGLALSDPLITFSYPFKTIPNDSNSIRELKKIIDEQGIVKIILGFPKKESGEPASISGKVIVFKEKLEKEFRLEILFRDERYTSSLASEIITMSVSKKSKRKEKGLIDMGAAAIILQNYLDEKKYSVSP